MKTQNGIQIRNRAFPYRTWWDAASPILNDTPVVYTTYNRTRIRNVHIYIYTYILTQSFWTGTKVIRRKHIVQPTLFRYQVMLFYGTTAHRSSTWPVICESQMFSRYRPRDSVIVCRPCVIIVLRGTLARTPPNICDLASVLPVRWVRENAGYFALWPGNLACYAADCCHLSMKKL